MGDMLTLIEQAERHFDVEQSQKAADKLLAGRGEFGLQDFLEQMKAVRKMGPLSKVFGMLPGMGQMRDQIDSIDEKDVDRIEAVIYSMTPQERANVSILNGSRRARIAKGAGVEVADVNSLVNRFVEARKLMASMAGMMGGGPGGAMPGGRAKGRPAPQARTRRKGAKGVSGNPAKRNAPQAAVTQAAADASAAFGVSGTPTEAEMQEAMQNFQLPPELQRMLNPKNQGPR